MVHGAWGHNKKGENSDRVPLEFMSKFCNSANAKANVLFKGSHAKEYAIVMP